MHQFSQSLVNSKVYPSELSSVEDQTNIVSKHNTEIVNYLQIHSVRKIAVTYSFELR